MKRYALATSIVFGMLAPQAFAGNAESIKGVASTFTADLSNLPFVKKAPNSNIEVESLIVPENALWSDSFLPMGLGLSNVGIIAKKGDAGNIASSLHLRFSASGGFSAESCKASFSSCTILIPKQNGRVFSLRVDGVDLDVSPELNPCSNVQQQCSLKIPSWGLKNLTENRGIASAPKVVAVVHHSQGMALVNAETGNLFVDLGIHPKIKTLGKMVEAGFHQDGTVAVRFVHGILLLDLARDQFLLADSAGLWTGSHGVAALAHTSAQQILEREHVNNDLGVPLYLDGTIAIWPNEFLIIKRTSGGLPVVAAQKTKKSSAAFVSISEGRSGLVALAAQNNNAQILRFELASSEFVSRKKVPIFGGESQIANSVLVGENIFQLTAKGYYYHSDSGFKSFSLSKNGNKVRFISEGHAFWPQERSNGCTLAHGVQNAQSPGDFRISGLTLPCAIKTNIRAGEHGVSAFELRDKKLTTHIWLPKPDNE
jgi:hypothetical protein